MNPFAKMHPLCKVINLFSIILIIRLSYEPFERKQAPLTNFESTNSSRIIVWPVNYSSDCKVVDLATASPLYPLIE